MVWEQDATMQGTPPVQCFNWSPCTVALLPTHLGSDLLQERVVFTPVVLRHRLHCLPDLLHPGNHIVVQHLRSTHTDNSWDRWTWEEDAVGEGKGYSESHGTNAQWECQYSTEKHNERQISDKRVYVISVRK